MVCNDLIFVRRYWPVTHIFVIAAQTENYIQIWLQLHTAGNMTSHKHTQSHTPSAGYTEKWPVRQELRMTNLVLTYIFTSQWRNASTSLTDYNWCYCFYSFLLNFSGTMHSIHSCILEVCFILFNGKQDTSNFVFPKLEIWNIPEVKGILHMQCYLVTCVLLLVYSIRPSQATRIISSS